MTIPMLGAREKPDLDNIKYYKYISTKRDGHLSISEDGKLLTRGLKECPNKQLQEKFKFLKDYCKQNNVMLVGEFYKHGINFPDIGSLIKTEDFLDEKTIKKHFKNGSKFKDYYFETLNKNGKHLNFNNPLIFYCFDIIKNKHYQKAFELRLEDLKKLQFNNPNFKLVEYKKVNNKKEVLDYYNNTLEKGYEGAVLRCPDSPYKLGRSSLKEEYFLKLIPIETFDAKIIGVKERMKNTNKSFKNEIGKLIKRDTKDAKESTGLAATFTVYYTTKDPIRGTDLYNINLEKLDVSIGGTEKFRKEIWDNKKKYIGKYIEYKCKMFGIKNKPRQAIFLHFRPDLD